MRSLVVGYGSIGRRHARLLTELGCKTAVLSQRSVEFPLTYSTLNEAIERHQPRYVVIANQTHLHRAVLRDLAATGFSGKVLIEKPIFSDSEVAPQHKFEQVAVAYNLRFHPILQRLRTLLNEEEILSVQVYAGQYLPDWRPERDYRESYSASQHQGGGVLRDLSHELDYLVWLLGSWTCLTASGGHVSSLEIDSEDLFLLLLKTTRCNAICVQMNYLDRVARRTMLINTNRHTIEVNLIAGTISIDRDVESVVIERDHTYREMHRALLAGDARDLCTIAEAEDIMKLIGAAEKASSRKEWVWR